MKDYRHISDSFNDDILSAYRRPRNRKNASATEMVAMADAFKLMIHHAPRYFNHLFFYRFHFAIGEVSESPEHTDIGFYFFHLISAASKFIGAVCQTVEKEVRGIQQFAEFFGQLLGGFHPVRVGFKLFHAFDTSCL
ncbi:MAG: hypothetical protein IKY07_09355 [Clostridia bacterium]|nr:hypothetical protein [Clostridia bacterium]